MKIDEEELAAQMREAIEYLKAVDLKDEPLRIDQCTVQNKPKTYFETQVPLIRTTWKQTDNRQLEMSVYHFMRFYKAVKNEYESGEKYIDATSAGTTKQADNKRATTKKKK